MQDRFSGGEGGGRPKSLLFTCAPPLPPPFDWPCIHLRCRCFHMCRGLTRLKARRILLLFSSLSLMSRFCMWGAQTQARTAAQQYCSVGSSGSKRERERERERRWDNGEWEEGGRRGRECVCEKEGELATIQERKGREEEEKANKRVNTIKREQINPRRVFPALEEKNHPANRQTSKLAHNQTIYAQAANHKTARQDNLFEHAL